jgi:predicted nicotinamide N-methyase
LTEAGPEELIERRVGLSDGREPLRILQPAESAELPDDGGVEWAPLVPYWSVLWRSGAALAEAVAGAELSGRRVIELGCGLGLPGIAAARIGAAVTAVDREPEAIELLERNAALNGVEVETVVGDWNDPEAVAARGPFDLALAADVLYEEGAAAALATALPLLAPEAWVADPSRPGRPPVAETLDARRSAGTTVDGVVSIHRLRTHPARARISCDRT